MKKLLSLILCVLLCGSVTAARRSLLQVTFTNGSHVVYDTDGGMRIVQGYDAESENYTLFIGTNKKNVTYNISDVKSLEFLPSATGIDGVGSDNSSVASQPAFSFSGKRVTIFGTSVSDVAVFGVDGTRRNAGVHKSDNQVTVDLSGLEAGSYIVKTNINSIKVQIR